MKTLRCALALLALSFIRLCISAALSSHSSACNAESSTCYYQQQNVSYARGWLGSPLISGDDARCVDGRNQQSLLPDFANVTHDLEIAEQVPLDKRDKDDIPTRTPRGADDTNNDLRPTPQPTGNPSKDTTVHIASNTDFAILLPGMAQELISDAESDGIAYCTSGASDAHCASARRFSDMFITAAAMTESEDGSWIQVTGCLDNAGFHLDPSDPGGQFDVRFPNGAQCTFGGYGASFIELVEPARQRFCLRCCASPNDQTHCNSHQDRLGCVTAIPGQYDFPEKGISCS